MPPATSPHTPVTSRCLSYVDETTAPAASASALATVPLDASGDFCVYTMSTTDVVVDLYAFSRASAHDGFRELGPTRLLDTRDGSGTAPARGVLTPDTPLTVSVASAGVPAAATAVALNITAVAPAQAAYVRVAPCGADPLVSSLNVQAGQIVANAGVVAVAADTLCVTANAATDVVLDVTGWYGPGGGDSTSVQPRPASWTPAPGSAGRVWPAGATLTVAHPPLVGGGGDRERRRGEPGQARVHDSAPVRRAGGDVDAELRGR